MVTKIPKSENGPIHTHETNKNKYLITWNTTQNRFTLWEVLKNGYNKLTTSNNPLNFYKYIDEFEK